MGPELGAIGNQLLVYDNSGLYALEAGHGGLLRPLPPPAGPHFVRTPGISVSPDGRWVLVSLTALDRGDLVLLDRVH